MKVEIFGDADTCVKIFNPTDRSLIDIRSNFKKAAVLLGISDINVRRFCCNKRQVFSPHLNMIVSLRVANMTTLPAGMFLMQ